MTLRLKITGQTRKIALILQINNRYFQLKTNLFASFTILQMHFCKHMFRLGCHALLALILNKLYNTF